MKICFSEMTHIHAMKKTKDLDWNFLARSGFVLNMVNSIYDMINLCKVNTVITIGNKKNYEYYLNKV